MGNGGDREATRSDGNERNGAGGVEAADVRTGGPGRGRSWAEGAGAAGSDIEEMGLPRPEATIAIPTKGRRSYLEVALSSIVSQAARANVEILVVDDGAEHERIGDLAARFGARCEADERRSGLNAARNTAVRRSRGDLIIFTDDDIEACEGWLEALLDAASERREIDVFTGPIVPRLEGKPRRSCGNEAPPITSLDLGEHDVERAGFAWGANMAIRRSAFAKAGEFDETLHCGGDEQEWQERLLRNGGSEAMYVAKATVVHRREQDDCRLRALMAASYERGRGSRRFDAHRGEARSAASEALTLALCVGHVLRRRCLGGLTMVAHSAGRLYEAVESEATQRRTRLGPAGGDAEPAGGRDRFLSGESGTIGGVDALLRRTLDGAESGLDLLSGRRARLAARARASRRLRVLAVGVEREERMAWAEAMRAELSRTRHRLQVVMERPAGRGKFEAVNAMLERHSLDDLDWLIVLDDDIRLQRGFLDGFLFLAERFKLDLAQPAHLRASHAAWQVTRRRFGSVARQTAFVEIGPLTAFSARTFAHLLPFPPLKMGWGLDLHWAAVARQRNWRCGVIDAAPIAHIAAPAASGYSRAAAMEEARAFLAGRPHLSAAEANVTLASYRSWR